MTSRDEWGPGATVAGRFVLVRRLGTGGSGEVWRADDLQLGRPVALKRLHLPQLPASRLEREAELASRLDHPRIVRTLGLVRDAGGLYLVQEYVAGGDARRLRGRPWREWVPVLREVAMALEAAHAAGLVHLDLTPGNVLLEDGVGTRLADFGVATALGATGTAAGSPYARSPAGWRGEPCTTADDLYGLGALAYEWLAGHPPYYPDIRAARVLAGPPPPPQSAGRPVPAALVELVMELLSPEATARPALGVVRERLDNLLARPEVEDATRSPALTPPELHPPASVPESPPAAVWMPPGPGTAPALGGNRTGWRSPRRWLGVAAAAVAVVAVMRWQPEPIVIPPPAARTQPPAEPLTTVPSRAVAGGGTESRLPTDPAELARLAARKSLADEQRDAYRQARDTLARLPVDAWAPDDWRQAQAAEAAAMEYYDRLDFDRAARAWSDGLRRIRAVAAARAPALAAALAEGQSALTRPDSRAARAAFERALAIQPGHPGAIAALRRATTLDEVTHLLDRARLDEQAGRGAAALAGYRRVLALDPATGAASDGIARLTRAAGEAAWRSTLARGWQQLAAGQREAARATFEQAARMRPAAPEVAEGLAQVEAGNRSSRLATLRGRAAAAEQAERWAEAEGLYREALALEPGVSFATEGRERTAVRARLDASLQGVVDDPQQALRPVVREMARVWLEQAAQQPAPRTRLQQQAVTVARLVAAAERPVRLVIESDGETQVTVLRTRRLGAVTREAVEVLPGTVVVVGTRPGYRDVRRELQVVPDSNPPPVSVRCEERI